MFLSILHRTSRGRYRSGLLLLLTAIVLLAGAVHSWAIGTAQFRACFVENQGQWNTDVRYCARIPGLTVWVTTSGIVYDHYRTASNTSAETTFSEGQVVGMEFIGSAASSVEGRRARETSFNFLSSGRSFANVAAYDSVVIKNLYTGIDLALYFENGSLRYDFIVAPLASPEHIKFRYTGAAPSAIHLLSPEELALDLNTGQIRHGGLFAFQPGDIQPSPVECTFELQTDGTCSFALGQYDLNRSLVIDPLVYASYIGGTLPDIPQDIATDSAGNIYITGYTLSENYPTTAGVYQKDIRDSSDIFITKIAANGNRILYSTYLGGNRDDIANALAVTQNGEVLVTGRTRSSDFPSTPDALDANGYNGYTDIFLSRISARGDELLYSTLIGGDKDDVANAIVIRKGRVYLTGETSSDNTFPITPDARQNRRASAQDAFLIILNEKGDSLYYSSYFGGNGVDIARTLTVQNNGTVYIGGRTSSTNLPVTAKAVKKELSIQAEAFDGFIAAFHPVTRGIQYCSYFGGIGNDEQIEALTTNSRNELVIGGWTNSPDLPVTPNAFDPLPTGSLQHDGFIAAILPDSSKPIFASYLGGTDKTSTKIFDLVLDGNDNIFCTGTTFSRTFPVTPDAFDTSYELPSNGDAFLTYVNSDASEILYSSYFGGSQLDLGQAIATSTYHTAVITGQTRSPDISFTPSLGFTLAGEIDGFIAKFTVSLVVRAPGGGETVCAGTPLAIQWQAVDAIRSVSIYLISNTGEEILLVHDVDARAGGWTWNIPSEFSGGHTYRLRIVDSRDNVVLTETGEAFTIFSRPVFTTHPIDIQSCPGNNITLESNSQAFPLTTYQWQKLDNGVWRDLAGSNSRFLALFGLSVDNTGKYRVKVWNQCDTIYSKSATVSLLPVPGIAVQPQQTTICPGETAKFYARSSDPQASIQWMYRPPDQTTDWQILVNQTSEELVLPVVGTEMNGWLFRAVFHDTCDATTTSAKLIVRPLPVIISHPVSDTLCAGENATFTVATAAVDATFQWQASVDQTRNWLDIPGAVSRNYSVNNVKKEQSGTYYRALVIDACSKSVIFSNAAELVIPGATSIITSSSALDFGVLDVCSNDSVISLSLTNTGTEPITMGVPVIDDGSSFHILASPSVLAPESTDSIIIRFAPNRVPADEQTLLHVPVGYCGDILTVRLLGKKVRATALSSLTSIDFGGLASCEMSPGSVPVTITNTSETTITLLPGLVSAPFSVLPTDILPTTLEPNESVQLQIVYAPETDGIHQAILSVPYTTPAACNDTLRITMRGNRAVPQLSAIDTVAFPVQLSCIGTSESLLRIVNTGSIPVVLGDRAPLLIGTAFDVQFPEEPVILKSGDYLDIPVSFTPPSDGLHEGYLSFVTAPCNKTYTIAFTGISTTPSLVASDEELDFTYTSPDKQVSFTNTSESPLTISALAVNNPGFSVATQVILPYVLLPDEALPVTVTYRAIPGYGSALLTAVTSAPCSLAEEVRLTADMSHPTPVAYLHIPLMEHRLAEQFSLPLLIDRANIQALQFAGVTSFRAKVAFNATMMTPVDPAQRGSITNGSHIIEVEGALAGRRNDTLGTVTMLAALGNATHTPVDIINIQWLDIHGDSVAVHTYTQSGQLHITDIRKGQLVNPGTTPFSFIITPVPADETVSLTINHLPERTSAAMEVFDTFGRKTADWTTALTSLSGTTEEGFGGTLFIDISALPAGVYYCRISLGGFVAVRSLVVR